MNRDLRFPSLQHPEPQPSPASTRIVPWVHGVGTTLGWATLGLVLMTTACRPGDEPGTTSPVAGTPKPIVAKTVEEILALHAKSLGMFARADFVRSAIVHRQGKQERVRITVRRKPFSYREDWFKSTGTSVLLSDGRHAWGAVPGRRMGAMGAQALRFQLLPAPLSRAVMERAFVMGRRYLDRSLWPGRSGVDAAGILEAFPHQGEGLEVGRRVYRIHVIAAGEARIQLWVDAEDGRLWAVTEPDVDRRWRRFGKFVRRGDAWMARERVWGLQNREGGSVWQLQEPIVVQRHAPHQFPFPRRARPAWRMGPRLQLRHVSVPWHRGVMVQGVKLDGHRIDEAWFDTGASQSALRPERVRALQLYPVRRTRHGTIGDNHMGMLYWFDQLRLPGIEVDQSVLLSSNPGQPLWMPPDKPVQMLLGGEAIFGGAPVLDLAGGQLLLRNEMVAPLSSRKDVGPVVELRMDGQGPGSVPLHVGDRKVMALVDTGWSGLFLFTRKAASELGLPTTREALRARGGRTLTIAGVGGAQSLQWELTVPSVRLGPIHFDHPRVSIQDPESGQTSRSYEALVGCGALARFRKVGFDPLRHKLEIEPGIPRSREGLFRVGPPPRDPGLLLRPAARSDGPKAPPTVMAIAIDSPAAAAGILPGDRLVALDKRPCHSSRFDDICHQLEQDVQGLSFTIQRGTRRIHGRFP